MDYVVDRLIDFSSGKDEELRDISGLGRLRYIKRFTKGLVRCGTLALKTITSELPPEGKTASKACEKLAPKLLVQLSGVSHTIESARDCY